MFVYHMVVLGRERIGQTLSLGAFRRGSRRAEAAELLFSSGSTLLDQSDLPAWGDFFSSLTEILVLGVRLPRN